MGTITVCDGGCGAQSPDQKTRLHSANSWLRVRAGRNTQFHRANPEDDLLFCSDCEPTIRKALGLRP